MQGGNKIERPYVLIFPEAKAFPVDDVLNFISLVEYPCDQDLNSFDRNAEPRTEFKAYLTERLLKSVIDGKFELWDSYLKKVAAPPSNRSSSNSSTAFKASNKPSTVTSFWRFLTQKFACPPEPSFVTALENPTIANNNQPIHPRVGYKTDFWWARMTCILKPAASNRAKGVISIAFHFEQPCHRPE